MNSGWNDPNLHCDLQKNKNKNPVENLDSLYLNFQHDFLYFLKIFLRNINEGNQQLLDYTLSLSMLYPRGISNFIVFVLVKE